MAKREKPKNGKKTDAKTKFKIFCEDNGIRQWELTQGTHVSLGTLSRAWVQGQDNPPNDSLVLLLAYWLRENGYFQKTMPIDKVEKAVRDMINTPHVPNKAK